MKPQEITKCPTCEERGYDDPTEVGDYFAQEHARFANREASRLGLRDAMTIGDGVYLVHKN